MKQNELLKPDHEILAVPAEGWTMTEPKLAEGENDPSSDFSDPEFSPGRKQLVNTNPVTADAPPMPLTAPVTPTQAKSDAVSKLLAKAVDRASELVLTPEESKALKAEFGDECFRKGAAGKENLLYLEHVHLRNRLDEVLGMGAAVLVHLNRWTEDYKTAKGEQAVRVYLEGALIVRGCYVTQSVGDMSYFPGNASQNYGDAVEGAESAVLRRCCKKFGIGLQAWSKTWCEGWWARNRSGVASPAKPALNPLSADNIETLKLLMEDAGYFEDAAAMKRFAGWVSDACQRKFSVQIEKITGMPEVFFPEAVKALKDAIKKNETKKVKEILVADFKFKIGDIVLTKVGIAESELDPIRFPKPHIVVATYAEECSGGIQIQYALGGEGRRYHEIELISIDDFDHEASWDAGMELQAKINERLG